jgi:hypothetical protein
MQRTGQTGKEPSCNCRYDFSSRVSDARYSLRHLGVFQYFFFSPLDDGKNFTLTNQVCEDYFLGLSLSF